MSTFASVSDDFAYRSAIDTAAAIARREVSSRELLDAAVARIASLDGPINAVVALDVERARSWAAAADAAVVRGDALGPLHGVPITVKDTFSTAGLVTTSGAPELAAYVPDADADPVARYKGAGAIVFGKTNTPLWAADVQTYNDVYGTTTNPFHVDHTPGGSSGGSGAALAAGFSPLELGSDIAGSIRIPSHWSGVCGHKPSYGIVSARGQIPGMPGTLTQADLAVVGPMARDVADLELALDLLVGPDAWQAPGWSVQLPPARCADARGLRVAVWIDEPSCPIDARYAALLRGAADALAAAGARVDHTARPAFTFDKAVDTFLHLVSAAEAGGWTLPELDAMAASTEPPEGDLFIGHASLRHREWLGWNERRLQQRARWRTFFESWDVCLLPVAPTAAIAHDHTVPITRRTVVVNGETRRYADLIRWVGLTGVCLLPATVVPIGMVDGLPVGVQIAGPYLEDRTTLAVGRMLEEALGGFRRPPGF